MKIEKLTDNKIRIIFNITELSKQNIDLKNLTKDNDNARLLFKEILSEAEKQVGFKVQNCKLLVEAYSTTEGYVVFTLTKYTDTPKEKNLKQVKFKRKNLNTSSKNTIYKFNCFEEFCNFCNYCNSNSLSDLSSFAKNISLYEYKGSFYLCFLDINRDFKYTNLFYTSISEFAILHSTSLIFKSTLDEHGTIIFKANALKHGIKYFVAK